MAVAEIYVLCSIIRRKLKPINSLVLRLQFHESQRTGRRRRRRCVPAAIAGRHEQLKSAPDCVCCVQHFTDVLCCWEAK
jgi:hypothetical protein